MSTLRELLAQSDLLLETIEVNEGEITPETEAKMTELDLSIPDKVDAIVFAMDSAASKVAFLREQAKEISNAARELESKISFLEGYVKAEMTKRGMKELLGRTKRFLLSPCKPSLAVNDRSLIPMDFYKQVVSVELMKDLIKQNLELGNDVPGCSLEGGFSLRKYVNKKLLGE